MAAALEQGLGVSAGARLPMQKAYDLAKVRGRAAIAVARLAPTPLEPRASACDPATAEH
jgi:plasmid maintenance system antidote protein VapI